MRPIGCWTSGNARALGVCRRDGRAQQSLVLVGAARAIRRFGPCCEVIAAYSFPFQLGKREVARNSLSD